ncbi:STAS domain-containing protein [Simplicispira metamorpha]|uniref:STAS domain-containing protein n=1 Tax=Simplicispira metamorpha TaxID=80881 RepID=A0A4R2N916_9BURK|nr:STAS domain-containing protein [Simplicispira metamorpha]TCP17473.1 STAS domain-containing protein [Simplicispira metamorpha]
MSKEESSPGGLLSKVVRFVRNPTVNWTELDTLESDRESQYSKQMLKEMIERKRRNDFVRKREFDQLRKLRQRDALVGQRVEDPVGRASFFQSSLTSPDDRAVTIKKIDEIEAQMSMQWWRGKQGGDTAPLVPTLPAGLSPRNTGMAALSTAFAPTAPASMPLSLEPQAAAEPLFANDSMVIAGFGGATSPMLAPAEVEAHADASALASPAARSVVAVEMEAFVHEPDLEEAAILFANADYAGASACLLDVVAQHRNSQGESPLEIWMTLFDLYRATGQQEGFDTLAIEFAACFGRSAPLWFSIPEQLGLASSTPAAEAAAVRRDFSWNAPSTIGVQSVAALQASLARAASPWMLVWSRLTVIEEAALPALAQEFNRWADQQVQLVFVGAERLQALLQAHTQSGDRGGSPEWWRLRMALLRCMGLGDEFELVALDYCVTYEVSPPAWQVPRCGYLDAAEGDGVSADLLAAHPPAAPDAAPAPAAVGLSGHIEGDADALLQNLESLAKPGQPLVVPCDRLIRIDFSAAGSVLNWAAAQQAQKREVHFQNLHRVVAVFFNVVGINEHAWVIPRKN